MVTTSKKWTIGILVILVFSTLVYVNYSNDLRMKIEKTKSTFYVNENSNWVVAGIETLKLYNGSKSLGKQDVNISTIIDDTTKMAIIKRETRFSNKVVVKETYSFSGDITDVSLFPVYHKIEIFNATGLTLQYEVSNLLYDGQFRDAVSPENFGHNMKVVWDMGSFYARISRLVSGGKLIVKYKINSSIQIVNVKLFDPVIPNALCYQESCNTTNQTGIDGDCGLNYSGGWNFDEYNCSYSASNINDGNWSSPIGGTCANSTSYPFLQEYYITETTYKPPNATGAIWEIGYINATTGNITRINITITDDCWQTIPTWMFLGIDSFEADDTIYFDCFGADQMTPIYNISGIENLVTEDAIRWEGVINLSIDLNYPENNTLITSQSVLWNVTLTSSINENLTAVFYNSTDGITYSSLGNASAVYNNDYATYNFTGLIKNSNYYWKAAAFDGTRYSSNLSANFTTGTPDMIVALSSGTVFSFKPINYEFYAQNVAPIGQTDNKGLFNITNNGTFTAFVSMNISSINTKAYFKCSNSSSSSSARNLSNSSSLTISSLEVNTSNFIWCWVDYNGLTTAWYPNVSIGVT